MSDHAPPLTLAERMAEALVDFGFPQSYELRLSAYELAGIELDGMDTQEIAAADGEAFATELLRRLGGANDPA
jgi:hypothetical protein